MGIDPRETRAMWEESLRMIPKIWEDGLFSAEGRYWKVPPREVRPKPYQKPQPADLGGRAAAGDLSARRRAGHRRDALSVAAPTYLAPHIKQYKERVRHTKPVGKFVQRPVAERDHGRL